MLKEQQATDKLERKHTKRLAKQQKKAGLAADSTTKPRRVLGSMQTTTGTAEAPGGIKPMTTPHRVKHNPLLANSPAAPCGDGSNDGGVAETDTVDSTNKGASGLWQSRGWKTPSPAKPSQHKGRTPKSGSKKGGVEFRPLLEDDDDDAAIMGSASMLSTITESVASITPMTPTAASNPNNAGNFFSAAYTAENGANKMDLDAARAQIVHFGSPAPTTPLATKRGSFFKTKTPKQKADDASTSFGLMHSTTPNKSYVLYRSFSKRKPVGSRHDGRARTRSPPLHHSGGWQGNFNQSLTAINSLCFVDMT
jgi:hypothetical protein